MSFNEQQMKKIRKYSQATGLQAVPSVPTTFVPRSSPHFMAALSGNKQDHKVCKTSVCRNAALLTPNPPKKHSTIYRSHLPMIHVTMDEMEEKSGQTLSPQRKVSSSNGPFQSLGSGMNVIDTGERFSKASNDTGERQRKISVKGASVLGETPLGRDLIFRRKISNTTAPPKKVNQAEEKERVLMKYSKGDNTALNDDGKKRMKITYFSRYNIDTSLLKGNLDNNWTARERTQSLGFVARSEVAHMKEKSSNKTFTSRTFPGESSSKSNFFTRDRAQSLDFVIHGSGSVKTRALDEKYKGLYKIMEEKRMKSSPRTVTVTTTESNLQTKPVAHKTNQLPASLFIYPQKVDYKLDKLSPTRETAAYTAPIRKDSQDRNAFLTFPSLRGKGWAESNDEN